MWTLTKLYQGVKKLFESGLLNAFIDARVALGGGGSANATGTRHDVGDLSGTTTINLDQLNTVDIHNNDTIKFNLTASADVSFSITLEAGETKEIDFEATQVTGSQSSLTLSDMSASDWFGYATPSVPDVGTVPFSIKATGNDDGNGGVVVTYRGFTGAHFIDRTTGGVGIAFDLTDAATDGNGDLYNTFSNTNRTVTFDTVYYTNYRHKMARMLGVIDQNSGNLQLTLRYDTTSNFSMSFGIIDLASILIGTDVGQGAFVNGFIGNFPEGAAWEYSASTQSGWQISEVRAGNVMTADIPLVAMIAGQLVTLFYKAANGHGWFFRDNHNIAGNDDDPDNDLNPHFVVNPNVLRRFAVSGVSGIDNTSVTILTSIESSATVNAHPDFKYASA